MKWNRHLLHWQIHAVELDVIVLNLVYEAFFLVGNVAVCITLIKVVLELNPFIILNG